MRVGEVAVPGPGDRARVHFTCVNTGSATTSGAIKIFLVSKS